MQSLQDRARIKQDGPSFDDVQIIATEKQTDKATGEQSDKTIYTWVPPTVLGSGVYSEEPKWRRMPKMNFLELYTGLQRRNWTSQYYDPNAVPWKLDIYKVEPADSTHA